MVRTPIQLTKAQSEALKKIAVQQGQSMAELIRQSVVQRRFGLLAAQEFQDAIVPLLEVEWVDQTTHSIAMQLLSHVTQSLLGTPWVPKRDCVT